MYTTGKTHKNTQMHESHTKKNRKCITDSAQKTYLLVDRV